MTDSPQGPYHREQPPTPWQQPHGYGTPQPQYDHGMQPYGGYGPPGGHRPQRTNTLAVVSLVTSVMLIWACGVGSLAAIICGHLGIREIDRSGGTQTGRGMAVAGLVIGYLGLLTTVLSLIWIVLAQEPGSEPSSGY